MIAIFRDRLEAGQLLAEKLAPYTDRKDVYVFALPRGGVPVAYQVARSLHAPLDVLTVRKIGTPGQPELTLGAIASDGVRFINRVIIDALAISEQTVEAVARHEQRELERQEKLYRNGRSPLDPRGRTIILVDDGLATGSTMRTAIKALRERHCKRIVVAVPVAPTEICDSLSSEVDEMIVVRKLEPFRDVGVRYQQFSQTTDQEVRELLLRAAQMRSAEEYGL